VEKFYGSAEEAMTFVDEQHEFSGNGAVFAISRDLTSVEAYASFREAFLFMETRVGDDVLLVISGEGEGYKS
jgi:hypothetical protein